ncbi:MAG: peptide deformylase [Chlamydiota bacterium]|nr:peptide deformylase [Chlamydiota bacterium]
MKLPLSYYGDPVLRKKGEPVMEITDEIKKFVEDMIETMEAENGIGLAAPQVGRSLRIFITHVPTLHEDNEVDSGTLRVFINPEILEFSEEQTVISEGCLSIPSITGDVIRPYRVKVKALDLEGNEFIEEFTGLESHCVLHENDHINGVLFIDRVKGKERKKLDPLLRKVKESYFLQKKSKKK